MMNYIKHQWNNISRLRAISLGAFLKRCITFPVDFYLRKGKSCLPVLITIDISMKCQMKCKMCYLKGLLNKPAKELTTQEWKDFIDTLHWEPTIYLTGGEPFMRPDLLEITAYIKKKGLKWGITTNGFHKDVPKIAEFEPTFVDISLDGIGDVHDDIRGVPGAFDKTVDNLKKLCATKTKKTRIFINFTVTDNLGELEKIIEITKDMGGNGLKTHHLVYNTPAEIERQKKRHPLAYYEAKDVKMDIEVEKIRALGKKYSVPIIFRPELSQDEIPKWYSNGFGLPLKCFYSYLSPRVLSNGDVIACQFIRAKTGNIREQSLKKIWNNAEYQRLRRLKQKGQYCELCKRCCKG